MEKAKSVVALVLCGSYRKEEVEESVARGIALLGGIGRFVQKEEKVLLKPNMLGRFEPEKAVTTHPSVFGAVGRLLRESGCKNLSFGDSPGPKSLSVARVAEGCGLMEAAGELGIPLADFTSGGQVQVPNGRVCKHFTICEGVLQADAIVSLSKMKTHALERLTGAVKNTYGCVLGLNKGAGHAKYPDAIRFARMLADLNTVVKPRLHIMDGIVAMEGNGPSSGTPVEMKVLLFSEDPVALDSVFCRLTSLPPALLPTNVAAEQAGVGTWREEQITVLTPEGEISMDEMARRYGKPEFRVFRGAGAKGYALNLTRLIPALRERPVADPQKCVRCGMCVESCPVEGKAIFLDKVRDKAPRYNYQKCIRCYCCQEMCPAKAISVYKPLKRTSGR